MEPKGAPVSSVGSVCLRRHKRGWTFQHYHQEAALIKHCHSDFISLFRSTSDQSGWTCPPNWSWFIINPPTTIPALTVRLSHSSVLSLSVSLFAVYTPPHPAASSEVIDPSWKHKFFVCLHYKYTRIVFTERSADIFVRCVNIPEGRKCECDWNRIQWSHQRWKFTQNI